MNPRPKSRPLNRLRFIFDRHLTVSNALDKAAAAHSEHPVFHVDDPLPYADFQAAITLRQLLGFANKVGNVLRDRCAMQRYDRVAIFKGNAGDYFFLGLAIVRAGGIAVPINGGMPTRDVARYLAYTGTRILITDTARQRQLRAEGIPAGITMVVLVDSDAPKQEGVMGLAEAMRHASDRMTPAVLAADDTVLIVHTSGTTGFPKGVTHTSGTLVAGVKGQLKIEPVFRRDIALTAAPFNHFINYLGLLAALVAGVPTWLVGNPHPQVILDLIDREQITVVFCFPHTYLEMHKFGLGNHDLSSVRLWLSGADASHEAHIRRFTERGAFLRLFGHPLIRSIYVDTLGSSEVGFAALFRFTFSFSKRFARYVGRPTFAGPRVKIADTSGRPLPAGQVGRLMVKGPTLFKGYWNDHDMLHDGVQNGWWWTGDIGCRDRRGRYYHYDRAVDVIPTLAGPVYTLPIEEELLKYPGIAEAVVVGRPCTTGAQVPIAVVQPMPGQDVSHNGLREWVNERLSPEERLADLVVVDQTDIPRGLTGKVLKRVVRERYTGNPVPVSCNVTVQSQVGPSGKSSGQGS
jgi:long-chain acyl-CoA synthetase